MFGLTLEKLLLVAVVAGLIIGPQRLPHYAQQLSNTVKGLKAVLESARADTDLGTSSLRNDWATFDPRQYDPRLYDPRRIVRDALADTPSVAVSPEVLAEAERVRPGQKFLITGSTAHPTRILIASLPEADPRRRAAELSESEESNSPDRASR